MHSHTHHHSHSGHDHGSDHHDHGHHSHATSDFGKTFLVAVCLNGLFVVIEAAYGFIANSTALMADAGHNLSDVMGLLLAWAAWHMAKRRPTGHYTYGLRSSTILAALGNAALLLVASGAIAIEALHRMTQVNPVEAGTVSIVAGVGILVNGLSALMLMRGSQDDLNLRGAYWHMLADALVSFGVVLSGLLMLQTGWQWVDPLASLVISLVIVRGSWGLMRQSLRLAMHAAPPHLNLQAIEQYLLALEGVSAVHDLHVWAISTTENALTVHLVLPQGHPGDDFLEQVSKVLLKQHQIHHSTIQIEHGTVEHACHLHQQAA